MKVIRILISLMLSIIMGNLIAAAMETPDAAYVITPALFGGGFLIPKIPGMLGSYVAVDVNKEDVPMPGFEPPMDQVVIMRARDVLQIPNRDSKGVVIRDDIRMKEGGIMMRIDATAGTVVYKGTAEGDNDSRGVKQSLEFEAPGYKEAIAEFVANNMNEDLYAALRFCEGADAKFFGSPCAKLQMKPDFEGNKDKTYTKIVLESANKGPVVAIYKGAMTFAEDFEIQADEDTPDVAQGDGRYLCSNGNTSEVAISGFANAKQGQLITLVGAGGSNLYKIEGSNSKFILQNGQDWTSLSGATITFRTFDANRFIEQSRS